MFATRKLQRRCLKSLSPLLQSTVFRYAVLVNGVSPKQSSGNVGQPSWNFESSFPLASQSDSSLSPSNVWFRGLSTSRSEARSRGSSMRSKVEKRMRKESGKTLREVRRAQKLKKKLMTEEERLIYNLKRARKKEALLLQKLKKYELPELPTPVHDPELLTPEQIQAYKKIGFKNKNYVPVGVRGVFGGVVQNMHMHWKFHETVQVCCDNFPKEKIKEMATMIARLSGGIVINIHDVKTIIMYRGRNYRQPKNLIPFNTLTKRKALFKARFEQALESQKLNIKKLEQQLRRMGVNPEDPVAMASIQRVAATFFNAIDEKEGSPYVFHGDKQPTFDLRDSIEESEPQADSDQEELDRFISEIEDAADKEWAAEEEAEKEEYGRIRYWNRGEFGGRMKYENEDSDDDVGRERQWEERRERRRFSDRADDGDVSNFREERDFTNARHSSDFDTRAKAQRIHDRSGASERWHNRTSRENNNESRRKNSEAEVQRRVAEEKPDSDDMLREVDNAMWGSEAEEEENLPKSQAMANFRSSSDEEEDTHPSRQKDTVELSDSGSSSDDDVKLDNDFGISVRPVGRNNVVGSARKMAEEDSGTEDEFGDPDMASGSEEEYDYRDTSEFNDDYDLKQIEKHGMKQRRTTTPLKMQTSPGTVTRIKYFTCRGVIPASLCIAKVDK